MSRHLVLHIGLSKTGSSSIQRVLAAQRPALERQNIYLPASPGWANHAMLPASLVQDPRILWGFHPGTWQGLTPAARIAQFRDEFKAEMASLPGWADTIIITAEQIGGLLRTDDEVARLADLLAPYVSSVQVIVYLRRQDQHVASAYSQWLRGGVLAEPGMPQGGPAELPEYDYGGLVQRYGRVFGEASIVPRIFARDRLVQGDVVADFLHLARATLEIPANDPLLQANVSISAEGQRLLLEAGRRLKGGNADDAWRDTPQWRLLAEAVTRALPGRGWQPTRSEAQEFMQRFANTNEIVRRRYFPDQPHLFDMDFSSLAPSRESQQENATSHAAIDVLLAEMKVAASREAEAAMAQFRLFSKLADTQGMQKSLMRAIKFAPELVTARTRMAQMSIERGDRRSAIEHLKVAMRLEPDQPRLVKLMQKAERLEQPGRKLAS